MFILIHSSKTMRTPTQQSAHSTTPRFLDDARQLVGKLQKLSVDELQPMMQVSPKLALATHQLIGQWTDQPNQQRAAVDSFLGDIYSGLQVQDWSNADRAYAGDHLHILSGLYGIVRPTDGIYPYRLEMGYKLPNLDTANMYAFWGNKIAKTLSATELILNVAAVEYSKIVTRYIDQKRIITPQFLSVNPKTGNPTFVAVHTKIARGAFAHWCIKHRVSNIEQLKQFQEIGYRYDKDRSTTGEPVFVCQQFGGLGLSVRLR